MLPLEMTLIERNRFAKGMTLPDTLSSQEATTRQYQVGDFGYWDAGPDLAISTMIYTSRRLWKSYRLGTRKRARKRWRMKQEP